MIYPEPLAHIWPSLVQRGNCRAALEKLKKALAEKKAQVTLLGCLGLRRQVFPQNVPSGWNLIYITFVRGNHLGLTTHIFQEFNGMVLGLSHCLCSMPQSLGFLWVQHRHHLLIRYHPLQLFPQLNQGKSSQIVVQQPRAEVWSTSKIWWPFCRTFYHQSLFRPEPGTCQNGILFTTLPQVEALRTTLRPSRSNLPLSLSSQIPIPEKSSCWQKCLPRLMRIIAPSRVIPKHSRDVLWR